MSQIQLFSHRIKWHQGITRIVKLGCSKLIQLMFNVIHSFKFDIVFILIDSVKYDVDGLAIRDVSFCWFPYYWLDFEIILHEDRTGFCSMSSWLSRIHLNLICIGRETDISSHLYVKLSTTINSLFTKLIQCVVNVSNFYLIIIVWYLKSSKCKNKGISIHFGETFLKLTRLCLLQTFNSYVFKI